MSINGLSFASARPALQPCVSVHQCGVFKKLHYWTTRKWEGMSGQLKQSSDCASLRMHSKLFMHGSKFSGSKLGSDYVFSSGNSVGCKFSVYKLNLYPLNHCFASSLSTQNLLSQHFLCNICRFFVCISVTPALTKSEEETVWKLFVLLLGCSYMY